jgi:hypothetical protein
MRNETLLRRIDRDTAMQTYEGLRRRRVLVCGEVEKSGEEESFFADDNSQQFDDDDVSHPVESKWLIPVDHPLKLAWDFFTILVSILGAYHAHTSIRDRSFGPSWTLVFCETVFFLDILLNFVTQTKTHDGVILKSLTQVWARYLTSWVVVDVISLLPWERIYLQPVIEVQKRRNFFKRSFFRTKAVVRVTRIVRGRHVRSLRRLAKTTAKVGVGITRLIRLLIKYVPKYIFFWKRMKGIVLVRLLRNFHTVRKFCKTLLGFKKRGDEDTTALSLSSSDSLSEDEDEHHDVPY